MKQETIINHFELIEDQIRVLEYRLLEDPCDRIDTEFAVRFAEVRQQLATIRVQYTQLRTALQYKSEQIDSPDDKPAYDLGAPRFPYDEF